MDRPGASSSPTTAGEFAAYVAASFRQALANGIWGWFDDDGRSLAARLPSAKAKLLP